MKHIRSILRTPKTIEFVRFCIVGGVCTAIDAGVFYLIHSSAGYRLAMIFGFSLSIVVNYLLNIFWSFNTKPTLMNALGILAAHCFNIFVVRMSLMWLFVDKLSFSDSIAYVPTLLISILTNFIIIRFVVKKF